MYCQPTPEGKLANKLKVALREVSKGAKTLVVEEGGKPLIGFLKKLDPFKNLDVDMVKPVV